MLLKKEITNTRHEHRKEITCIKQTIIQLKQAEQEIIIDCALPEELRVAARLAEEAQEGAL